MEKEINEGLEKTLDYLQDEVIPSLKRQIEEKQQRIDKAVDYILNNYEFYYGDDLLDEYNKIVNILKGDE